PPTITNTMNVGQSDVYGYKVSKLVYRFSNLTRYGTNFKPVHVTPLEPKEYGSALAMYGVMAGIAAAVLTLSLLLFCCFNCIFGPKKGIKRPKRPVCSILIVFFSILGAATFSVGFIGQNKLDKSADAVC